MKFGGKIHNCDRKNEFDFGSDLVKVKIKRGQKVKREKKARLFRGICALSERLFLVIIMPPLYTPEACYYFVRMTFP